MSVLEADLKNIFRDSAHQLDRLQGTNILITGACGFLGYELSHVLASVGFKDGRKPISLVLCDNLKRGKPKWLNDILHSEYVDFINHDVTLPLPNDIIDFDYIIHAASIASPTFYRQFPIQTIDANVYGLRNLLEYASKQADLGKEIRGLLFFSTSEIYGDPEAEAIPTSETYRGYVSCTGPRACYDESKRLGETLCVSFANEYKIPVKIARPFNNYGPGLALSDGRVLPDFFGNVLKNEDIVLFSDGSATRTFCYISDAISGYLKILVNGRSGEAYNIGIDKPEVSIIELAEEVVTLAKSTTDYTGSVVHGNSVDPNYLTDNPNRRCPNIDKARHELGFEPVIGLSEGLRQSLKWYLEN